MQQPSNSKDLLACPKCYLRFQQELHGEMKCESCGEILILDRGVYTSSIDSHYSDSFGLQWNRFKTTQLDSANLARRSSVRFVNETGWNFEILSGKTVLDAGCGAGRFAEVALELGGHLIAVDASTAIYAAKENLQGRDALFVRSDLASLPLKSSSVEYVYCIGVLQHTKNPEVIVRELIRVLKKEGELTLTFYEDMGLRTRLYSKYLVRPITKRIEKTVLLKFLTYTSRFWFPATKLLFSLPSPLGKMFAYFIPIANYVNFKYDSIQSAKQEAILDTFDMLSPSYDRPIKKNDVINWVLKSDQKMTRVWTAAEKGTVKFRKN
jgi:ubiquinone/menaquinone biosynthesis C-methylase UbiE